MNLNRVIIIGRLTHDPQLRTTPTGQSVATISVATGRVWTDKGGSRQEETEYHSVVVWGRQAEIASQYLTKGSVVFVEGRLQTRGWQDKQGQSRKTTEIICDRLQLGPKPAGAGGAQSGQGNFSPRPQQSATGSAKPSSSPTPTADMPPLEDIPVINLEDEMKAEDLPF